MTVLFPFRLPSSFLSFFAMFNVFSLDMQLLPFNCLFESNFHSMLLATTISPLVFMLFVYALYATQRFRIQRLSEDASALRARQEIEIAQSKCEFTVILVFISAYPIISTTIFQTFAYDARLGNGQEYLRADYTIERSDPTHQMYVVYSCVVALLYCIALPVFALHVLYSRQKNLKMLQKAKAASSKAQHSLEDIAGGEEVNPLLAGLSPLYKDFRPKFWWFQIIIWVCTTFQTGIVTAIPAKATSQVVLSLLVSIVMLVALADARPYMSWSDDMLAQSCQIALVLVQIVGLLQMNECVAQDDWLYGPILILCTAASGGLGIVLILTELFQAVAPDTFEKISSSAQCMQGKEILRNFSSVSNISTSASVAPVGSNNGELAGVVTGGDRLPVQVRTATVSSISGVHPHGPPGQQTFSAQASRPPTAAGPLMNESPTPSGVQKTTVQKLPAMDRNFESFTPVELRRFKTSS